MEFDSKCIVHEIVTNDKIVATLRKELYEMMKQQDQLERKLEAAKELISQLTARRDHGPTS